VIVPGPQERLQRRHLDAGEEVAVWWLGVHGGAGESTLEELFSGSRGAGHSWPLSAAKRPPARVVLVARTHARGLRAAQSAIREWEAGDAHVVLLGLVLIADRPGRLPHELRQLVDLVSRAVPAVWRLPWIEAWSMGEPPGPHNAPNVVVRLLEDLRAMTSADAPATTGEDR
jgi:acetyl-CoA acetyltransferase